MKDRILKIRFLFCMMKDTLGAWYKHTWLANLDDNACCSGRECGCYGASKRQEIESSMKNIEF